MFKLAQVGDKVWSICFGDGVILSIDTNSTFGKPVKVGFEKHGRWYTYDGKFTSNMVRPDLYWQSFELGESISKPPLQPMHQWLYLNAKGEYRLTNCRYKDKADAGKYTDSDMAMLCPVYETETMETV